MESKLVLTKQKKNNATQVIQMFQEYVGNPGDIVTRTKPFDGGLQLMESISKAKVIGILVNYSSKMEKLLDEMRTFMTRLELVTMSQSTLLE